MLVIAATDSLTASLVGGTLSCRLDQVRIGHRCVDRVNRDQDGHCNLGYVTDARGDCSIQLEENEVLKNGIKQICSIDALLRADEHRKGCVCVENATQIDADSCRCKAGTYQLVNACHEKVSTQGIEQLDAERLKQQGLSHIRTICGYGSNKRWKQVIVLQMFYEGGWVINRGRKIRMKVFLNGSFQEQLSKYYSPRGIFTFYSVERDHGGIYTYKPWSDQDTSFRLAESFCHPHGSSYSPINTTTSSNSSRTSRPS
jgi:hypothetical protein